MMFNVYIVSIICVFSVRAHLIYYLKPHSVVCPAPSSLIFVSCSNVFFLPLVFFSIVIMVKAGFV